MKASELVSGIKNLKAGGVVSQSTSITDMQYLYMIDYYRAILIRQQQSNGYKINDRFVQDLEYLTVEDYGRGMHVTERDLPVPIEVHNSTLITHVSDTYDVPYQRSTLSSVAWTNYSRLTRDEPKWFHVGAKIGVVNHKANNKLRVWGVFEHPYEVLKFLAKHDEFDPLNFEYPMSATMVDTIYKMIVESEFRVLGLPQDRLNNSSDENQS